MNNIRKYAITAGLTLAMGRADLSYLPDLSYGNRGGGGVYLRSTLPIRARKKRKAKNKQQRKSRRDNRK